mmetsp:Transcript_18256/g.33209  ORF Transcript_18256/g.33209 Transcript_18256/m.33209 type:complete len:225 (+) Transcript_18256:135-809(+)
MAIGLAVFGESINAQNVLHQAVTRRLHGPLENGGIIWTAGFASGVAFCTLLFLAHQCWQRSSKQQEETPEKQEEKSKLAGDVEIEANIILGKPCLADSDAQCSTVAVPRVLKKELAVTTNCEEESSTRTSGLDESDVRSDSIDMADVSFICCLHENTDGQTSHSPQISWELGKDSPLPVTPPEIIAKLTDAKLAMGFEGDIQELGLRLFPPKEDYEDPQRFTSL